MRHGSDRTEANRCARCQEVQDEVMAAAQQANNTAQFYYQLRVHARAAEKRIPVDVEDDTESWLAFDGSEVAWEGQQESIEPDYGEGDRR